MSVEIDLDQLKREVAYYKQQVDSLAGENLKLDYTISSLRHELKQKKSGFSVLSNLHRDIGAEQQISSIFNVTIYTINSTLGMDKTVALMPTERQNVFSPAQWAGFLEETVDNFRDTFLEFPERFIDGTGFLVVNKKSEKTEFIEFLQRTFDLPYFICLPVLIDAAPAGILLSGRMKEAKPLYPPLDQGDIETFQAIAGLISSSVKNMRVATLEESNRLQKDFFANMSHEFRTPITLTLGPIRQLAQGRFGRLTQTALEQLEIISRNQERLLNLVNQILDLAKLESGGMELRAARVPDVNQFILYRMEPFEAFVQEKGARLTHRLDPNAARQEIYLDADKFDKVIANLLSNAVKFTSEGSIHVITEVVEQHLKITVTDSGIGIKEDQLPHIFDRFRQAEGADSRGYMGTGIGLALVKEIVELHGGSITAQSRYGKGTSFAITLPLGHAHLDREAIVAPEESREAEQSVQFKRQIIVSEAVEMESLEDYNRRAFETADPKRRDLLYVEDNADLRKYLVNVLAGSFNIFLAENGRKGLEFIEQHMPDIIITDSMMPSMSGPEMIKAIRDFEKERSLLTIPVLMLTARAGSEDQVSGLDTGANDYVTKPFKEEELLARIRNLLRQRKLDEELVELNKELSDTLESLNSEKEKSERLLLNILPRKIADRLKRDENPIVDELPNVSVLFADIVRFTELTRKISSVQLVTILNAIFSAFDNLTTTYRLEKIKTIGDAYMVVGGLLVEEDQSEAIMQMAIEMFRVMKESNERYGTGLQLRVGVHRGPAIAGVIGARKFVYDLWGDTVNTASRMESNGLSNAIQVSEELFSQLNDKYTFEIRKKVKIKGLGTMNTYIMPYPAICELGESNRRQLSQSRISEGFSPIFDRIV
jgi:signal transduction histidine kinase/class 3 adenylate cyclase/CheY-like chemotaxis protein